MQLKDEEKVGGHLKPGSAVAHTTEHSLRTLNRVFGERVLNRSPDIIQ
jgi:hypothetical protein